MSIKNKPITTWHVFLALLGFGPLCNDPDEKLVHRIITPEDRRRIDHAARELARYKGTHDPDVLALHHAAGMSPMFYNDQALL